MKASELRIGNRFLDYAGEEWIVTGRILREMETGGWKDSSAIPLTEDWLLRMGFNMQWNELRFRDADGSECDLGVVLEDGTAYIQPTEGATKVPCQYVHQLQNLYFFLTGEELTIKE